MLGGDAWAWTYGPTPHDHEMDEGNVRTLIAVHGFRGDHHGLEPLAQALCAHDPTLRVVVPDLPGFGETAPIRGRTHNVRLYARWLRDFVETVAPGERAMLGHSFGSLVLAGALGEGLSASAVCLINPITTPALSGPQAALTAATVAYYRAGSWLPPKAAQTLLSHPAIVRLMSEVMAKSRQRELRSWIHAEHAAHFSSFADPHTLLQAFRASVSNTVPALLQQWPLEGPPPTLVIAGEIDDITPLDAQLSLHHQIPGSSLRIARGVGHLVHYEAIADASTWLATFLAEAQGSREAAVESRKVHT